MSGIWNSKKLSEICEIRPQKRQAKKDLAESDSVSFVPMEDLPTDAAYIKATQTRPLGEVYGGYTYFADGDVLLAKITPCFQNGKIAVAQNLENGVGFGSSEFVVFRPSDSLHAEYLYHFLSRQTFRDEGVAKMSGAVGHQRVPKEFIENYKIPLPHPTEQKRIVAILEEAFGAIAKAKENAARNLANFDEIEQAIYREAFSGRLTFADRKKKFDLPVAPESKARGRAATDRRIMGEYALAVGEPTSPPPLGWQWVELSAIARLESGHTPSRRKPEYWGGDVPWIGIKDAREHHGTVISSTLQTTNALGIANSAARLLPEGTVCLSRTASVGYVVVMGKEMATSQDFVNWVCSDVLDPHFLMHLLIAEKPAYRKFSSGSVHQTIYFPEVKAFHICVPHIDEQQKIVRILDQALDATRRGKRLQIKKLAVLDELKQSILQKAFTGQLTSKSPELELVP